MPTSLIYPALTDISNVRGRIQAGEQLAYNWLSQVLSEHDEVLLQPYLSGVYPDAIVRRNGMLFVIEVKDYFLPNFTVRNSQWIRRSDERLVSNPLIQVRDYAKRLRLIISSRLYIEHKDTSLKNLVIPVIVFTNALDSDVDDLYERSMKGTSNEIKRNLQMDKRGFLSCTLFQNDLVLSDSPLMRVFNNEHGNLSIDENMAAVLDSAWGSLKNSVVGNTSTHEVFPLDAQQRRWIEHRSTQFKLHGVAGTGKSTVLAHRVARVANTGGVKVLVIHCTNTLGNQFIRRLHSLLPEERMSCIEVLSLYSVMKKVADESIVSTKAVKGSVQYLVEMTETIRNTDQQELTSMPLTKYDAVFVDEAQDIDVRDLDVIRSAFLREGGGWYLFGDVEQNTFGRTVDVDSLPRTNIPGRWGILKRVYRSQGQKASVLQACHNSLFNPQSDSYEINPVVQRGLFEDFTFSLSVSSDVVSVRDTISQLVGKRASSSSSIGIITVDRRSAQCIHWSLCEDFKRHSLPYPQMPLAWYGEQIEAYKRSVENDDTNCELDDTMSPWSIPISHCFWRDAKRQSHVNLMQKYQSLIGIADNYRSTTYGAIQQPTVSIGTLQLFKGLEFNTVIFIGSTMHSRSREHDIELWTAISRARTHVHVVLPPHSPYKAILSAVEGVIVETSGE